MKQGRHLRQILWGFSALLTSASPATSTFPSLFCPELGPELEPECPSSQPSPICCWWWCSAGHQRNEEFKQEKQNKVTIKVIICQITRICATGLHTAYCHGEAAIVTTQKTKKIKKQDVTHYCATRSEPELFIYRQHRSSPSLIPAPTVKSGISAEEPDLLAC